MISVIVPVYNTEKYLLKCVNSIAKQSFSDVQTIIVDDGSIDDSACIMDEQLLCNSQVIAVHKKNSGVSNARNTGILVSGGELISFCDSDDTLPENSLEFLQSDIKNHDLSIGYFETLTQDNRVNIQNLQSMINVKAIKIKENFAKEFDDSWNYVNYMSSCGKLFKSETIKRNFITFPENMVVFEDFFFVLSYISKVNSIKVVDKTVYTVHVRKTDKPHEYHRSRSDYVDDYLIGEAKLKDFLSSIGLDYSEKYWRTILRNLRIAYEVLWDGEAKTESEKRAKRKRIKEVLLTPTFQYKTEYEESMYTRIEYHLLKKGNVFFLERLYKIRKFLKKNI